MKRAAVQLGISFACWTALAVTNAVNQAAYRMTMGAPADIARELRVDVLDYWIWAALTPIIFALARRAPFTRRTWGRAGLIHAGGFLALSLAHEALADAIHLPSSGRPLELRFLASFDNDLWMYGAVLIVASGLHFYQRFRERDLVAARLGEKLVRAELQALRNQLNPHLLFNALNSVAALMHEDVQAADDMLADLSHLLRVYLSGDPKQETTLREELELVDAYVGIQKRRFADRLSFSKVVAADVLGATVPALLLQPLVENAILHGIAPSARPGSVRVTAERHARGLRLIVADDGLGMAPGLPEGIGLSNTRARLLQLYGQEQSLEIGAGPGTGVVVTITMPLRMGATVEGAERNEDPDLDRGRRAARPTTGRVAAEGR